MGSEPIEHSGRRSGFWEDVQGMVPEKAVKWSRGELAKIYV